MDIALLTSVGFQHHAFHCVGALQHYLIAAMPTWCYTISLTTSPWHFHCPYIRCGLPGHKPVCSGARLSLASNLKIPPVFADMAVHRIGHATARLAAATFAGIGAAYPRPGDIKILAVIRFNFRFCVRPSCLLFAQLNALKAHLGIAGCRYRQIKCCSRFIISDGTPLAGPNGIVKFLAVENSACAEMCCVEVIVSTLTVSRPRCCRLFVSLAKSISSRSQQGSRHCVCCQLLL